MQYIFSSRMRWSKGEAENHKIDLDLDLAVEEILKSNRNIETRLKTNEQGIREEIFELVIGKILPKIIDDTGVDFRHPDGKMSIQSHSQIENEAEVGTPTREETSLYIRDRMRMTLDLTTDRPVNAIQALHANRGGVAADISNELMKLLKKSVLKVDDQSTETSWSISGNRLESLEHTVRKSSADSN